MAVSPGPVLTGWWWTRVRPSTTALSRARGRAGRCLPPAPASGTGRRWPPVRRRPRPGGRRLLADPACPTVDRQLAAPGGSVSVLKICSSVALALPDPACRPAVQLGVQLDLRSEEAVCRPRCRPAARERPAARRVIPPFRARSQPRTRGTDVSRTVSPRKPVPTAPGAGRRVSGDPRATDHGVRARTRHVARHTPDRP